MKLIRRMLSVACCSLIYILTTVNTVGAPAVPEDFGQGSETVSFDNLSVVPLTNQLAMQGIFPNVDSGQIEVVVDTDINIALPSPTQGIRPSDAGATIDFRFNTPKDSVGIWFLLPKGEILTMEVYNEIGDLLESVSATSDSDPVTPPLINAGDFIGITLSSPDPEIHKVRIFTLDPKQLAIYDDLIVFPTQEDSINTDELKSILGKDGAESEKLDAIEALLKLPSQSSRDILLDVMQNDDNPYIRENAILALMPLGDPNLIDKMVAVGQSDSDAYVRSYAQNAVHEIRKNWPMPDPPIIDVAASGPLTVDQPITFTATITSPVYRNRVQVNVGSTPGLLRQAYQDVQPYEGELMAGVPLVRTFTFIPEQEGRFELPMSVHVGLNSIDGTTYRQDIYIEIGANGGSASTDVFTDLSPPESEPLPIGDVQ